MLLGLSATAALGLWQYSVAHRDEIAQQVLHASAVPLDSVSRVGEYVSESSYAQKVTASGILNCSRSFTVTPSVSSALWRVCPLTLNDGSKLAVVTLDSRSINIAGRVSIMGRLQPAQDTAQLPALYSPTPHVDAINTDDLVLRWQSDTRDGYVVLSELQTGEGEKQTFSGITAAEIVTPPVGIELRNLLYAWQWWVFGSFVVFLYGRFVRDELRARTPVSRTMDQ